jgi:hypothetical protein
MTRFQPDPEAFPSGFFKFGNDLKYKYEGLKNIMVWHAMLGYWGAISPDGELAQKFKTVKIGNRTCIAGEDVERFYEQFYRLAASFSFGSQLTIPSQLPLLPRHQWRQKRRPKRP